MYVNTKWSALKIPVHNYFQPLAQKIIASQQYYFENIYLETYEVWLKNLKMFI